MRRTVHVIGAGLAGLAAAVRLADTGAKVVVHEAAGQAGGRCRSYHDQATDLTIDNGNHLVLSGNRAALDFVETLGSRDRLVGPASPDFPFVDLADRARWTLRLSEGRLPWWIFDPRRRVPGTRVLDYLRMGPLLWASGGRTVCEVIDCASPLHDRLLHPLLLAALNTDLREGAAALAAPVIRQTLARGGAACRPLIARTGLGEVFVDPAIEYLAARDAPVLLRHELRELRFAGSRVSQLDFGEDPLALGPEDAVVLATPPYAAASLVPGLTAPTEFRAIVNAHFRVDAPGFPPMIGVLNGATEWIFSFPRRLSVTISNADRLLDAPRETLARTIWQEVAWVAGLPVEDLPPWQIVRERRATFAATPEQNAKRPGARTQWSNLVLAGDWTATGLPATIEGAIRSGNRAAEFLKTM